MSGIIIAIYIRGNRKTQSISSFAILSKLKSQELKLGLPLIKTQGITQKFQSRE